MDCSTHFCSGRKSIILLHIFYTFEKRTFTTKWTITFLLCRALWILFLYCRAPTHPFSPFGQGLSCILLFWPLVKRTSIFLYCILVHIVGLAGWTWDWIAVLLYRHCCLCFPFAASSTYVFRSFSLARDRIHLIFNFPHNWENSSECRVEKQGRRRVSSSFRF